MTNLETTWRYIDDSREQMLADLFPLLRQPSISAQNVGVADCAELLATMMRADGLTADVVATKGHPAVIAHGEHVPGAPTLLVYGHYDVQPTGPDEAWTSPPFEPTIRDGRVYARGSGDNKGQIFAQLMAYRAWRNAVGQLPVNLTFLVDGEEESSSPHLPDVIREQRERLQAHAVYVADGPVYADGRHQLILGARGTVGVRIEVTGATRDYHSGHKGNVLPNPVWELTELLATMRDQHGRILIPGFYDDVREPDEATRAAADRLPIDDIETFEHVHGVGRLAPVHFDGFHDRTMFFPALNLTSFHSGYDGEGRSTSIPARATANLDVRLVKDQNPDDIYKKIVAHVAGELPHAVVRQIGGAVLPSRTSVAHPAVTLVRAAVERVTGEPPVVVPSSGGTLPTYVFPDILGLPVVSVPYANTDEANHAPNENLDLERFYTGIKISASVFEAFAGYQSA